MVWLCTLVSLKATQYLLLFYRTQVLLLSVHFNSSLTTFLNFMSRPCWKFIVLGQSLDWIVGPGYSFGVFSMSRFAPLALSSVDDPKMLCLKQGDSTDLLWSKNVTSRTGGCNWPPLVQKHHASNRGIHLISFHPKMWRQEQGDPTDLLDV